MQPDQMPTPNPGSAPEVTSTPHGTPPQQPGALPPGAPMGSTNGGKSKRGLVLGIVGGIVALAIVVLVVGKFTFLKSKAQPKKVSDSSKITTDTTSKQPTKAPTSGPVCLGANDFPYFADSWSDTPQDEDGVFSEFFQLEFDSNVATYTADSHPDPTAVFNDFKKFYAAHGTDRKYVIELESSVNSATPDDALANARNDKVKSDLETISGIPADKITVLPVSNETGDNSAGNSFFRQVQIELRSDTTCSTLK